MLMDAAKKLAKQEPKVETTVFPPKINEEVKPETEECSYCGVEYLKPVELHHTEEECKINQESKDEPETQEEVSKPQGPYYPKYLSSYPHDFSYNSGDRLFRTLNPNYGFFVVAEEEFRKNGFPKQAPQANLMEVF